MKLRCFDWFEIYCFFWIIYTSSALNSKWGWECIESYCEKKLITTDTEETALSLPECWLVCTDYASLWPKPTGVFETDTNRTVDILNRNNITISGYEENVTSTKLFEGAANIFKQEIYDLSEDVSTENGKSLSVYIDVNNSIISHLTLNTDESYTLNITSGPDNVEVYITASNFFGVRHAMTTLGQLIVLDDLRDQIKILSNVYISDGPAYSYRGILLDTARSYIKMAKIKSTIRGMAASKLNVLHWHMTDSQSFPYKSRSHPELSEYGAYSPSKVYTPRMIANIVDYAAQRGIRVIPEIDAPAHVGEGWQYTGYVTCYNWQPFTDFCNEPPCGQFDPTQDGLYDVLGDLYGEVVQLFDPQTDIFHIGGDEVNVNCWNSTKTIVDWIQNNSYDISSEDGFIELWSYFLNKSVSKLYEHVDPETQLVIWQNSMTYPAYLDYLDKDRFVIQIWLNSSILTNYILQQGYKIINSNFDGSYLDCGFGNVFGNGSGYCSYNSWKTIYNNTPESVAGDRKDQVLGSIVAYWTEQGGSEAVETRVWPRAAALAEVLWSEPNITTWEAAEQRFLVQRERLILQGVQAGAEQMEWCLQHEEHCRYGAYFYVNPQNSNSD